MLDERWGERALACRTPGAIKSPAAAIHGAPVTTLDFDFMFRDTPVKSAETQAGRG